MPRMVRLAVIFGLASTIVLGATPDGVDLYGWPARLFIAWAFTGFSGTQNYIMCISLALICGAASWHLIEKKALRLKKRLLKKPVTSTTNSGVNTQGALI